MPRRSKARKVAEELAGIPAPQFCRYHIWLEGSTENYCSVAFPDGTLSDCPFETLTEAKRYCKDARRRRASDWKDEDA